MNVTIYQSINEIQGKDLNLAKEDLYHLWQECFRDSKEYTDFYFKWKVTKNRILTLYKQDFLCSMLHLNPYELAVQGKLIPANYIVGVATKKEERKQGFMRMLLEKALHDMYREKMPFTYLMPAAEAIYSPYDFRVVYTGPSWNDILRKAVESLKERGNTKDLNLDTQAGDIIIKPLNPKDIESIKELVSFTNKQLSKEYDIYVHRDTYYYERLIHEMRSCYGEVLVCIKEQKIIGYVSYMAEEKVYITEMITNEKDKESIIEKLAIYVKDTLKMEVHESKEGKTTTIMARIVDFVAFVSNITASEEFNIKIKIFDSIIKENNKTFLLEFTKEGCKVAEIEEEPDITLNIAEATNLFFGNPVSIQDKNQKEVLDKLNKYTKVFINDVV